MIDHINENEQWEAIKQWWRKNGVQVIVIFVLSLAIGLTWRYWQEHKQAKAAEASSLFEQLLALETSGANSAAMTPITTQLENNYPSTPYAILAALFEAKNAVAANDLPLAEKKLRWALERAKANELHEVSLIRLARVLLAEKKPDEAMALLQKSTNKNYFPAIEQVKGDIYVTQGQIAKARAAYQNAVNSMPDSADLKSYVQMQLNQLPKNP